MYRAILPDGEVACAHYERGEHGVDLYDDDDQHVAFVPYEGLVALFTAEADEDDDDTERSIM